MLQLMSFKFATRAKQSRCLFAVAATKFAIISGWCIVTMADIAPLIEEYKLRFG